MATSNLSSDPPRRTADAVVAGLTLTLILVGSFSKLVAPCCGVPPLPPSCASLPPDATGRLLALACRSTNGGGAQSPLLADLRLATRLPQLFAGATRGEAWLAVHTLWATAFLAVTLCLLVAGRAAAAAYSAHARAAFSVGARILPGLVSFASAAATGRVNGFHVLFFDHFSAWNLWYPFTLQVCGTRIFGTGI